MAKLLEVKEFETIVGNRNIKINISVWTEEAFADLLEFIHAFQSNEIESDILDFMRIGYKRNVGETVTFKTM